MNRKLLKACLLKRILTVSGAIAMRGGDALFPELDGQLRWQGLWQLEKLAELLLDHLDRILNHSGTKFPLGVVEAV